VQATLVHRWKDITPEGNIIEVVIWRVPAPVELSAHKFKYRLAYIVDGVRLIGFDNERGKGDHCHNSGEERTYRFEPIVKLIEDFLVEVEKQRRS